jgi:hypothetical protein
MSDFIYQFNIKKDICNQLINHHITSNKKGPGFITGSKIDKNIKDSIDLNVYPDSELSFVKDYYKELQKGIDQYYDLHFILKAKINVHTKEPFVLQHYYPDGGFKAWHFERSDLG